MLQAVYPINVRLTMEQGEALTRESESTGKSVSVLVREAVEIAYIKNAQRVSNNSFKLGDVTFNIQEAKFHGRREDGVYVPIIFDPMDDTDMFDKKLGEEYRQERLRLINEGKQIVGVNQLVSSAD